PYSDLLAGKLVACLIRTDEVRACFAKRYANSQGIISGERKRPRLALVTTSSAFGRSSIYNRVTLNGCRYLRALGYTQGFGHFHIPDELFACVRNYLALKKHAYSSNFRF